MYGLFHWGFTAWAVYCIPTLPLAYMLWNKKRAVLRLSAACAPVIGAKAAAGWQGTVIDVLFMFGLIGGIGTSMGLGTPMLSAGIAELFGVERSFTLDVIVVLVWGCIFGASVYSGLEKGIKVLSDVNLWLILIILGFTFLFGPTVFMLSTFTNSMGLLASNFVQMSFWTDPIAQGGFPQGWTIFYWAWWIAYAPFMGLFVARISYGRTIRQLIVAEVLGGSFGCWLFFGVLGNTGMYFDLNGIVPLSEILNNQDGAAAVVATVVGVGENASLFGWNIGFRRPGIADRLHCAGVHIRRHDTGLLGLHAGFGGHRRAGGRADGTGQMASPFLGRHPRGGVAVAHVSRWAEAVANGFHRRRPAADGCAGVDGVVVIQMAGAGLSRARRPSKRRYRYKR